MWLPQENEDKGRQKDYQPTPSDRSQKTHDSISTFPKSARLRKRSQYQKIFRQGRRIKGQWIAVDYCLSSGSRSRLGITVSKKHGKSHDRNRFKRIVREAFRELQHQMPHPIEMNISPRQSSPELCKAVVLNEMQKLLQLGHASQSSTGTSS